MVSGQSSTKQAQMAMLEYAIKAAHGKRLCGA
jgi:hypothetical protein